MFKRRQNACCVVINDDFEIIGRNIYTESMLEIKHGLCQSICVGTVTDYQQTRTRRRYPCPYRKNLGLFPCCGNHLDIALQADMTNIRKHEQVVGTHVFIARTLGCFRVAVTILI